MSLIELENACKTYHLGDTQVHALNKVNLTIEKGERTVVWGPSGSGKSTLLNLLGLIDQPTSGALRIDGKDMAGLSDNQLTEMRYHTIGFVFQNFNLSPILTAEENVMLPLQIRGVKTAEASQRARAVLEEVGLGTHLHHRPDKMSGGQRQRTAVARALVTNPSLILADEPTANLDSETAVKILEIMRELNEKKQVTFLFSTHDPQLLEFSNRRIQLKDGVIVDES